MFEAGPVPGINVLRAGDEVVSPVFNKLLRARLLPAGVSNW